MFKNITIAATLTLSIDGVIVAKDDTYNPSATACDYAIESAYAVLNGEADPYSLCDEMRTALAMVAVPWPDPSDDFEPCGPATLPCVYSHVRTVSS